MYEYRDFSNGKLWSGRRGDLGMGQKPLLRNCGKAERVLILGSGKLASTVHMASH